MGNAGDTPPLLSISTLYDAVEDYKRERCGFSRFLLWGWDRCGRGLLLEAIVTRCCYPGKGEMGR